MRPTDATEGGTASYGDYEEVTIIPFKAADLSQGRSYAVDRCYANFGELRTREVR